MAVLAVLIGLTPLGEVVRDGKGDTAIDILSEVTQGSEQMVG